MRYRKFKASDVPGLYIMDSTVMSEGDILEIARQLSQDRLRKGRSLISHERTKAYLQNLMQGYEHEVFAMVMLDPLLRVIRFQELFRGSISASSIYPREVVKTALAHNAVAVILAHNHPSGISVPSQADIQSTKQLKDALALVDIRVVDHIVVGRDGCTSMSETGQM
jgi:DNA repair protein RadC